MTLSRFCFVFFSASRCDSNATIRNKKAVIWDLGKRVMVGGGVKTGFFFGPRVFIHDSVMVDWEFSSPRQETGVFYSDTSAPKWVLISSSLKTHRITFYPLEGPFLRYTTA